MRGEQSSGDRPPSADADQVKKTHDLALFELFTRGRFEVRPPRPGMNTFAVDLTPLAKGEPSFGHAGQYSG